MNKYKELFKNYHIMFTFVSLRGKSNHSLQRSLYIRESVTSYKLQILQAICYSPNKTIFAVILLRFGSRITSNILYLFMGRISWLRSLLGKSLLYNHIYNGHRYFYDIVIFLFHSAQKHKVSNCSHFRKRKLKCAIFYKYVKV